MLPGRRESLRSSDSRRATATVGSRRGISKGLTGSANGLATSAVRKTLCLLSAGRGWKAWVLTGILSRLAGRKDTPHWSGSRQEKATVGFVLNISKELTGSVNG